MPTIAYVLDSNTFAEWRLTTNEIIDLVDLQLLGSNNLSDLPDIAQARTNLDVYSKAETDHNISEMSLAISLALS